MIERLGNNSGSELETVDRCTRRLTVCLAGDMARAPHYDRFEGK